MTTTYRPLLKELTIKESSIEGLGLFASKDIVKGTDLGVSHRYFVGLGLERTPLGGFYNHSDKPNCIKKEVKVNNLTVISEYHLIALKDIKAGEEILVSYTFYNIKT